MSVSDCSDRGVELERLLLEQLGDKWSLLVLRAFCGKDWVRFNAIKRSVPGVTQKTLTACLRKLERNGIVVRQIVAGAPLGVAYSVTPLGETLAEPFMAMQRWAEQHLSAVKTAQAQFDTRQRDTTPDRSPLAAEYAG